MAAKKNINWQKVRKLGKIPDRELAEMLGVNTKTVQRARIKLQIPARTERHDWDNLPLGEVPDDQLAKKLKVNEAVVQRARYARKIPRCGLYVVDWDAQPLGEMTDQELAALLGCSREAVLYQRHKRGIEAFGKAS